MSQISVLGEESWGYAFAEGFPVMDGRQTTEDGALPAEARGLVERLYPEVLAQAEKDFGGRGSSVAEEWAIAASRLLHSGKLAGRDEPRIYLWAVYHKKKKDALKRRTRDQGRESFDEERHCAGPAADELDRMIQQEACNQLLQQLGGLDSSTRRVAEIRSLVWRTMVGNPGCRRRSLG